MAEARRRWLILVHQLPAHPSNLRVRVWRRLQQVGAVVLRNSLYVLPSTDDAREDFNWVREEIVASGGQVSVLEAAAIDGYTDAELEQQFRTLSTDEYESLAGEIRRTGEDFAKRTARGRAGRDRTIRTLRERFAAIQARDHFGAAGKALVEQAFRDIEAAAPRTTVAPQPRLRARDFRRRTWVTRQRPGIDRLACAWFIRRFIDPAAQFAFADGQAALPRAHIPFDMPDVEFGHHGAHCTFETLAQRFGVAQPAVGSIARIVHDLDLKESRYGMPECPAVARLVQGLRANYDDDHELLEQGIVVMEALYRSFADDHQGGTRARRR